MKKLFGLLIACLVTVSVYARLELITMTTDKNIGENVTLEIGSTQPFSIDWGNGEKTDYDGSMVNYTQLASSEIKGNTIKIYGESTGFTYLSCCSNKLIALDVSNATSLTHLYCYYNQISSLDVSKNTALKYLLCSYNMIANLNVNNNPALTTLECEGNQLTKLDIGKDLELLGFQCSVNQLTAIDVSNNTKLAGFSCTNNQLTVLDVSKNKALVNLECNTNQLTSLNVSNSLNLNYLDCSNNQLSNLDVSRNSVLFTLFCSDNQLSTLNIGVNNTSFTTIYCSNNELNAQILNDLYSVLPDITNVTIKQSDPVWKKKLIIEGNSGSLVSNTKIATDKGWICDVEGGINMTNMTELISMTTSKVMGDKIGLYLSSTKTFAIDWGNSEKVGYAGESNTIVLCKSSKIKGNSIKIYGDTTALSYLSCSDNQLTTLNVSNNPALIALDCSGNQITNLDVSSNNTRLTYLYCYNNKIRDKAMTTLVNSLYERPAFYKGELYIIETSNPAEGNIAFKTDVDIAINKNWTVWNWIDSREQSLSYIGSDPTGIKELQAQGVYIYNPTGYLNVTTEKAQMISIFTYEGQLVYEQTTNHMHIPIAKGIYIVKVGNTAQKIILK